MDNSSSEDTQLSGDLDRFGRQTLHTFSENTRQTVRRNQSVVLYKAEKITRSKQSTLESYSNFTFRDYSETEYSTNNKSEVSLGSSTLQSSTDDSSFLAITGIFTRIDGAGSDLRPSRTSSDNVTPPPPPLLSPPGAPRAWATVSAALRCSTPAPSGVAGAGCRAVGTQVERGGHVSRHTFERKVRSVFPERGRPPTSSNVFILLTDATGQTVFAVNTRAAAPGRRKPHAAAAGAEAPTRLPRHGAGRSDALALEMNKRFSSATSGSIAEDAKCVHSASALMLNASTQTARKLSADKRSEQYPDVQQETCAFCMDDSKPMESRAKPRCSESREMENSSDGIICHYRTAKAAFDLHKESESVCELAAGKPQHNDCEPVSNSTGSDCSSGGPAGVGQSSMVTDGTQVNFCMSCSNDKKYTVTTENSKLIREKQQFFEDTRRETEKMASVEKPPLLNNSKSKTNIKSSGRDSCGNVSKVVGSRPLACMPKKTKNRTHDGINVVHKNTSKVNINIDADKECYNVSIQFSESRHENLTIRTIMKKRDRKASSDTSDQLRIDDTTLADDPVMPNDSRLSEQSTCNAKDKRMTAGASLKDDNFGYNEVGCGQGSNSWGMTRSSADARQSTSVSNQGMLQGEHGQGPGRHYRGDGCRLPDPLERDREICRLLGVERRNTSTASKSQPSWPSMLTRERHDFIQNARKKSISSPGRIGTETPKEMTVTNKTFMQESGDEAFPRGKKPSSDILAIEAQCGPLSSSSEQAEPKIIPREFVENCEQQTCKHTPIKITQSEYLMLKKTFHRKLPKTETDHRLIKKSRVFVRKNSIKSFRKPVVTTVHFMKANYENLDCPVLRKQCKFHCKSCCNIKANTTLYHLNVETQTFVDAPGDHRCSLCRFDRIKKKIIVCNTDCSVLTVQRTRRYKHRYSNLSMRSRRVMSRRNAMSSMELNHRKTCPRRPVTYSLCDLRRGPDKAVSTHDKWSPSVFTLFKGRKDATRYTPNLGTSTFTLCRQSNTRFPAMDIDGSRVMRKNKSFLKKLLRFMSRRKSRDVACQVAPDHRVWSPLARDDTPESSVDSYHINSSLEGIEVSSSIYDTSVSHFSQHTTVPVVTKKRASSVAKKIKRYWKKSRD